MAIKAVGEVTVIRQFPCDTKVMGGDDTDSLAKLDMWPVNDDELKLFGIGMSRSRYF